MLHASVQKLSTTHFNMEFPFPLVVQSLVHRTPSLDRLDDRMSRSLRHSIHYGLDSSSSDEEEISGIVSPVSAGKGLLL